MKLKRIFWLTLRQCFKLAFITSLLAVWLTMTTSGLRLSIFFFNKLANYSIQTQELYGSLATGFTAYQTTLSPVLPGDIPQYHFKTAKIKPHWSELWKKTAPLLSLELESASLQAGFLDEMQINHQNIALDIDAQLALTTPTKGLTVKLGGTWQGHPVNGQVLLSFHPQQPTIQKALLTLGDNLVALQKNNTQGFDVNINVKYAEAFSPVMQGQLQVEGWLDALDAPQYFQLKGQSKAASFKSLSLKDLNIAIEHNQKQKTPVIVNIDIAHFKAHEFQTHRHKFKLEGTLLEQTLHYDVDFNAQHLKTTGKIKNTSKLKQLELSKLELTGKQLAKWQLSKPAKLVIENNTSHIQLELQSANNAHLKLSANDKAKQQEIQLSVKQLPLGILKALSLVDAQIPGKANIEFNANATNHVLQQAKASVKLSSIKTPCKSKACIADQWMEFDHGDIEASFHQGTFKSHYVLQVNDKNKLHGQLAIKNFLQDVPLNEQTLQGELKAQANDLSFIMQWLPEIARLRGEIDLNAKISGSLIQPEIISDTQLKDGTMTLPRFGIKVKPLSLRLTSDAGGTFYLQGYGKMRDTPGDFTLTGSMQPFAKGFPNRILLRSKNTQWANTNAFNIIASPTLAFEFPTLSTLNITGDVIVEKGNINLDSYQEDKTVISDDVVLVSSQGIKRASSDFQVRPHILIKTANTIELQGNDIRATLSGNLLMTKNQGKLLGDGRITIKKGTYQLPGETLTIERGRLTYPAGTLLSDPVLDIRLMKATDYKKPSAQQKDAGIYILGHLSEMEIENMGWMEGSTSETFSHALSMSSNTLINPLQKKLKLDKIVDSVGVTSVDRQGNTPQADIEQANVAFVIGKRLSDRIYAQVMKSFLDDSPNEAVEKARLNVELTKNASLGFEVTPKGQGVDLSFSIESD